MPDSRIIILSPFYRFVKGASFKSQSLERLFCRSIDYLRPKLRERLYWRWDFIQHLVHQLKSFNRFFDTVESKAWKIQLLHQFNLNISLYHFIEPVPLVFLRNFLLPSSHFHQNLTKSVDSMINSNF